MIISKKKRSIYCMKLHIFDNLSDKSSDLSDFKTFLKYSLLLYNSDTDLLISEQPDADSEYIEAIFAKCHEICSPLFHRSRPYFFLALLVPHSPIYKDWEPFILN